MKLKLNRFFISILSIALCSFPTYAWKWGSEGTGSTWTMPTGLAGCKWFNYYNGWIRAVASVKFINWTFERPSPYPWCYEGVVSTIMLYYQWPNTTYLDGYWNSSTPVRLEHTWDYACLKNSDCAAGNPLVEPTSNNIPGYSMGVNEIGRLYSAVMVATNSGEGYGHLFPQPVQSYQRLFHSVKNQLGFCSAQYILATDANAITCIRAELQQNRPVIVVGTRHCWNLDGYRSTDNQYHILDANGMDWHCSLWKSDPNKAIGGNDAYYYIYNLDPTITIPGNPLISKLLTFSYGDDFIKGTSNTVTNKRIRIINAGTPLNRGFNVTVRDDQKTYFSDYRLGFRFNNQELTLPSFSFQVPATSNTLQVVIRNSTGSDVKIKMVIDDYSGDSGTPFGSDIVPINYIILN